jgi:hypothetical protein
LGDVFLVALCEEAPDAPGAEEWIKKNKPEFKRRYGSNWARVLYGKAWILYGKNAKNKDTAKAWVKFMLEDSDFTDKSGFIPTIKAREPGLAQLKEFMSYQPTIIPVKNNSPRFTEVGNRAKIDFYGGSYVQSVMLSSNFEQALEQLDARWDKAKKRVK